ncbi:MAG: transposase [Nanoarchaeota archaeon]|nr:transposase [Nanoarchaeota archaeon]
MGKQRRFTEEFKKQVVMEFLSGSASGAQVCRKYGVSSGLLYHWKTRHEQGRLNNNPTVEGEMKNRIAELERMVGKLTMKNEILKRSQEFFLEQMKKKESSLRVGSVTEEELSKKPAKQ